MKGRKAQMGNEILWIIVGILGLLMIVAFVYSSWLGRVL